ncbi:MAG: hypothetical protein IIW70_03060 [Bacteroidales bacterium]|nr:hypothetical protein [Bacteroidales bacterium]
MKKYFLSIVALAGMLFATSCQESLVEPQMEGPTTFIVQVPDAMGTKAIGDKENVNQLLVAVYTNVETDVQPLVYKTVKVEEGTGRFDVSFDLIKGQTYDLIFWAQTEDAYVASGAPYDLRSIEMNRNFPNNEKGAAFFHFENDFKVDGGNATIILRRPFAQLNLRTTAAGLVTDANTQPMTLYTSKISVTNVATKFNTVSGMGEDAAIIEFDAANVPQEDVIVDNVLYKYVSMNYLPVVGDDRALVDVTAEIDLAEGPKIKHSFTNIPLQENYRTNIMGNLISGTTDFEVIINDKWFGDNDITNLPYFTVGGGRYDSFIEAYNEAQDGDVIKINGGIPEINATADIPYVTIDKNITLDLNGYGLNASIPDVTKNTMIFKVLKGVEFTIKGEGNVHLNTAKCPNQLATLISNEGGIVNIESGNYTITALEYPDALIPTFIDNNSTLGESVLNIKGGKFTYHRHLFRNFANNKSAQAIMNISGGEFNGLPYDEGAIWNQKPSAKVPNDAGVINVTGGVFNNVVIDDEFAGVVYANTQEEMNTALSDANTHTIMLGAGVFVADIYNGTPSRKSLTIIGSEGTKFGHTATTGGQLRLDLFESFTIRNCEIIQRSGVKTWGHIVFGSGNKANGVYTIENCTFNGVGTQGIYINENTTGATYNILNCTFNGNFGVGHDGAITIQTNKDVECIVNVKGCEFKNIPDGCRRIYLAPSTEGLFYDLTLNTDLKATTAYEIETFIKLGFETINLADGNYEMPMVNLQGKKLTLVGSKAAIIDVSGVDARNQFVTGATIAFEGLTLNFGTVNYMGFANTASLTYKDCDINGLQFLYGNASFEGCNFDSNGAEHSVWTYGAKEVNFTNCDFTYSDRCINCYNDNDVEGGKQVVNFTNCEFATANTASEGAVEINSCFFSVGIEVNLTSCTAPAYGEMAYVSPWDSTNGSKTTINIE